MSSKQPTSTAQPPLYEELVPHYMRTRRKPPRVLAVLTCMLALVVFLNGTHALAILQQKSRTAIFENIRQDTQYFTIRNNSQKPECLAALQMELTSGLRENKGSQLRVNGKFKVSNTTQTFPIAIASSLTFDSLGELSQLSINLSLASLGRLALFGPGHTTPLTATLTANNGKSQSFSLFPLERIYLVEYAKGAFRLRLPRSLSNLQSVLPTTDSETLKLVSSSDDEFSSCEEYLSKDTAPAIIELPLSSESLSNGRMVQLLKKLQL